MSIQHSIRPALVMAEFDSNFKGYYDNLKSSAPTDFFSDPKIYMHDPVKPVQSNWAPSDDDHILMVPAKMQEIGFYFNTQLGITQLAFTLAVDGYTNFRPYGVLLNEPYSSSKVRAFCRGLITLLMENPDPFEIKVFRVNSLGSPESSALERGLVSAYNYPTLSQT